MDPVHDKGVHGPGPYFDGLGPWTESTEGVHGPGVHVLYFPVNFPRNKEDATKCCNARTRLTRRRRVIERILAEELEKSNRTVEMVNRNK